MSAPTSTFRPLLPRMIATRLPALALPLLLAGAAAAPILGGCGDSEEESAGLSAGATCEGAAPVMCSPECDPLCNAGAWSCACPEGTASTTSSDTTDATTSGETSASTGDGSTGDTTTTTTTDATGTTTDSDATTTDSDATTDGGSTSTSGDDTSTGSTTEEPWEELQHVHIEIDNFCQVSVDPPEIHVPADKTVTLSYHNHSVDYEADVWLSYGGGYLELALGDTWDDPFEWCTGPNPQVGYADISIAGGGNNACPKHQMKIHCE